MTSCLGNFPDVGARGCTLTSPLLFGDMLEERYIIDKDMHNNTNCSELVIVDGPRSCAREVPLQ